MTKRLRMLEIGGEKLAVISYPVGAEVPATLSRAEREVLEGLLAGRSRSAIAKERGRAKSTISRQVESLYRKLGVSSRAELVVLLARGGGE